MKLLVFILNILLIVSCNEKYRKQGKYIKNVPLFKVTKAIEINKSIFNSDAIVITAVGDIMLGSNYPLPGKLPEKNILEKITPFLQEKSNIIIGNLEGTLFDSGGAPRGCNDPRYCYRFRTPVSYGRDFKTAGFDFLSIANNHSGDFGNFGRDATMKNLDSLKIHYAGVLKKCEYSIKEKKGIKFAFIGAGHNPGLVSINEYTGLKKVIKEAKAEADILIVMFHGGAEGLSYRNVPSQREFYLEEDRGHVSEFARVCINSGADVVIGSGPHVTRAVELYKNKFIAYSLGNFATYGGFNLTGESGKAPILKVFVNRKGDFLKAEVISTYQSVIDNKGPEIDLENRALKYIQELTKEDFPHGSLAILDNGDIVRNK